MPDPEPPRAAYVHIPFCVSKCHYCDFNSLPGLESIFAEYVSALITEVRAVPAPVVPLDSVYFGGGTPTVLPPHDLSRILQAIDEQIGVSPGAEITVEANPGTVDEDKLAQLYRARFNRLSLGVQSFDDGYLRRIGRAHTADQAIGAYRAARTAGFGNIGIDLIFALPGQSLTEWDATLNAAVSLQPEHVSLYELSIEEGTEFARLCASGDLELPDEDTQVDMYELAIETLTAWGYEHYEVSNFARPGCRSRHNQVYWRNDPYYGFGAGATSYVGGVRARRIEDPREYVAAINRTAVAIESSEQLTGRAMLAETVIQGLRMLEGLELSKIKAQTWTDVLGAFAPEIDRLRNAGLVEIAGDRLRVTHRGLLLLNDVSQEFLA